MSSISEHYYRSRGFAKTEELQAFALEHGFTHQEGIIDGKMRGMSSDSKIYNMLSGKLSKSGNEFQLFETKGIQPEQVLNSDNLILAIKIPDTMSQFFLDSRLTQDWESLFLYTDRILVAENEFSKYFRIFTPPGHESDSLVMLAPNTMMHLLKHLSMYDYEIVDGYLYVYTHYNETKSTDDIAALLTKVDQLIGLLRLRVKDSRLYGVSAMPPPGGTVAPGRVARTAVNTSKRQGLKHKEPFFTSMLWAIGFPVVWMLVFVLVPFIIQALCGSDEQCKDVSATTFTTVWLVGIVAHPIVYFVLIVVRRRKLAALKLEHTKTYDKKDRV